MPLSIASNITSLRVQSEIAPISNQLGKTFEKLSSGLRINRGSDDPAGLALADSLRANARIATVAVRNANDGISVTSITDSALEQVGAILQRMAELAEQGGNGTYSIAQMSALSTEFVALGSEIDRISKITAFNNINLLSNSSSVSLQVGLNSQTTSQITLQSVLGTLESLGLAAAGSSALSFSLLGINVVQAQSASVLALDAINAAIGSLTTRRGLIGAVENRLSYAIDFLSTARENFLAAESRIRDVDLAQEAANMVRLQILQQAGTAMLAQANQQPQIALKLLG
ncbi:MAG: flagellin FliC [Proteobacteria bacterium]|nr:flagellin FliC [Pseudomonadota bacterium]